MEPDKGTINFAINNSFADVNPFAYGSKSFISLPERGIFGELSHNSFIILYLIAFFYQQTNSHLYLTRRTSGLMMINQCPYESAIICTSKICRESYQDYRKLARDQEFIKKKKRIQQFGFTRRNNTIVNSEIVGATVNNPNETISLPSGQPVTLKLFHIRTIDVHNARCAFWNTSFQ